MSPILIPVIGFLVTGAVWITFIYFRSKEKQMMIEKDLTNEQISLLLEKRNNSNWMLQLGVLSVGLGVGLGLGFLFDAEEYMGFFILTSIGIAAIIAWLLTKKYGGRAN